MRSFLAILLINATIPIALCDTPLPKDNVYIDDEIRTFTIIEKDGEIKSVKAEKETTYTAQRADDSVHAMEFYNSNITIDKASATGAKPYYRSWESSDNFYDGSRICYMEVPVKKGKTAKATFLKTYKAPEHFCDITLASGYHTRHGLTVINVPAKVASRIKVEGHMLPDNITLTSRTAPDGGVVYTVETNDLPPFKNEPGAPSPSLSAPRIIITGYFRDVADLYGYMHGFAKKTEGGSEEIDRLAGEIASKASGSIAIADSCAAWVRQNIRYLAIEHGEYAFRPDAASDVLKNRAGDCKGSANLIKELLRSNGLDGRLVWIGTKGEIPFDWDKVPALCSGNHVIAACMLPDTTLYLDGTTTWSAPGYLPPSIRGRRVIIEDGDNFILSNVPDHDTHLDGEHISATYSIAGNDLWGEMKIGISGVSRMSFLSSLAEREPRDRERMMKGYLNYPRKNAEATDISLDCDLSQQTITLSGKVTEKNCAKKIGDKIYLDLQPLRDSMTEAVDTTRRTREFSLPYGYRNCYSYTVALPEGYAAASLPEATSIDNEWHRVSIRYSQQDGTLTCEAEIETKETETPLARIPALNESIKSIRAASDNRIILSPR